MSMPTVIYDELCDVYRRWGRHVPEGTSATMAWAPDARGRVTYGGPTWVPQLNARPDGSWCEDRPLHELSNAEGVD